MIATDPHAEALRLWRLGFDAGQAAEYQWPKIERPADAKLHALNAAQLLGPVEYAVERAGQGLVLYDLRGVQASWDRVVESGWPNE